MSSQREELRYEGHGSSTKSNHSTFTQFKHATTFKSSYGFTATKSLPPLWMLDHKILSNLRSDPVCEKQLGMQQKYLD